MFLLSIVKLLLLFIFIYFLFSLFRIIFKVSSNLKKNAKESKNMRDAQSTKTGDKGSIIELKKDQYKVE